ncbi:MAG TPA: hypothetical protein VG672_10880 [Bryobacteraceae bacterium]|jgi:hypothetical protein|nr:hypothetical protein [Bryobacteraceae bacterium]
MALDLKKIDDRIRQLQEIRRIASNPELAKLLSEFTVPDEGIAEESAEPPQADPVPDLQPDEVSDFVKGVLQENDAPSSNGLLNWKNRKG